MMRVGRNFAAAVGWVREVLDVCRVEVREDLDG